MNGKHTVQEGVSRVAAMIKEQRGGTIPVTELLHRCGCYHTAALPEIVRALQEEQGIDVDPCIGTRRWHTLRLTPNEVEHEVADDADLEVRTWRVRGDTFERFDDHLSEAGLRWIDVPHQSVTAELPTLLRELVAADGGPSLSDKDYGAIVSDLASPDHRPNRHVFGDRAKVRTLAAFAVEAVERPEAAIDARDEFADKTGVLELRLVEMVIGQSWIVTVRFPSERVNARRVSGRTEASHDPTVLAIDGFRDELQRRWRRGYALNALDIGDFGILMFHQLVDSYRDAVRLLESWLRQWELQAIDPDIPTERNTLTSLRLLLEEFESRVDALGRPHRGDPVNGWFPRVNDHDEAKHVLSLIRETLGEIDRMQERVRAAFDVLDSIEGDRGRHRLELFATFIAIPAVLTGFLGMNIWLPLNQRWWSFGIAVLIMVITTAFAYRVLVAEQARGSMRLRSRR